MVASPLSLVSEPQRFEKKDRVTNQELLSGNRMLAEEEWMMQSRGKTRQCGFWGTIRTVQVYLLTERYYGCYFSFN